ncbi:transposase [Lentzea sp. CA-135723]|uniref:transposase n=1 Tax=Lentzea sp. CA-135723 TaxID=3239950 RepID=UPI003D8AA71F
MSRICRPIASANRVSRKSQVARLRAHLRDFYPVALAAFGEDLAAADVLELLKRAPDPDAAAKLPREQIVAALQRAGRRKIEERADRIHSALRADQLRVPAALQRAYAVTVKSLVAVIAVLVAEITAVENEMVKRLRKHADAEIYLSQPGMGETLSARALGEFGDDRTRYASPKARKNYAGTSPVTIASGRKTTVNCRYVRNTRLVDSLMRQAMSALSASPGARACYDRQRARGVPHNAALRHLANRLVGILHGCLTSRTTYDETTAWAHHLAAA